MCRFVFHLGPPLRLAELLTEPRHSLIQQSLHSEERVEPLNGDGFGVAWYVPELGPEPGLFRCTTPAWNDANLHSLARVTRSPCILAHVRAATPGMEVVRTNCHPFVRGRLAFLHNGEVPGFHRHRRAFVDRLAPGNFAAVRGTTDSEHLFALFLEHLGPAAADPDAEAMAGALEATLVEVLELVRSWDPEATTTLNLAVTDGRAAVLTRFAAGHPEAAPSLHWSRGRRYSCAGGVCRMLDPGPEGPSLLVASEPLSEDPGWQDVAPDKLLLAWPDHRVELRPLQVGSGGGAGRP